MNPTDESYTAEVANSGVSFPRGRCGPWDPHDSRPTSLPGTTSLCSLINLYADTGSSHIFREELKTCVFRCVCLGYRHDVTTRIEQLDTIFAPKGIGLPDRLASESFCAIHKRVMRGDNLAGNGTRVAGASEQQNWLSR